MHLSTDAPPSCYQPSILSGLNHNLKTTSPIRRLGLRIPSCLLSPKNLWPLLPCEFTLKNFEGKTRVWNNKSSLCSVKSWSQVLISLAERKSSSFTTSATFKTAPHKPTAPFVSQLQYIYCCHTRRFPCWWISIESPICFSLITPWVQEKCCEQPEVQISWK